MRLQFTSVTLSLCWCWCFPQCCSSGARYTEASLSPVKFLASVAQSLADGVCVAFGSDFWNCCSCIFLADITWAGNITGLPPPQVIRAPLYPHGVILAAKFYAEITQERVIYTANLPARFLAGRLLDGASTQAFSTFFLWLWKLSRRGAFYSHMAGQHLAHAKQR